jgi:hypothetical protein
MTPEDKHAAVERLAKTLAQALPDIIGRLELDGITLIVGAGDEEFTTTIALVVSSAPMPLAERIARTATTMSNMADQLAEEFTPAPSPDMAN